MSSYVPRVESTEFLLGTKVTVGYLSRLDVLGRSMPESPVLACVREPRATIASWIRSFPHLRDADPWSFPVGGLGDLLLPPWQRYRMAQVDVCEDPRVRRALLWRHLAVLILEHRKQLDIVRYEELTNAPQRTLDLVMARLAPEREPPAAPVNVAVRHSQAASELDAEEQEIIEDICGAPATELGYDL